MRRSLPIFLLLVVCAGCQSFFYPSREKYLDLRVVASRSDGSPAVGIPVKVYPRPGWRAVPVGPALQQFIPIFQGATDDTGRATGPLADYFAYTLVVGSDRSQVMLDIVRKDVMTSEPIKVTLR